MTNEAANPAGPAAPAASAPSLPQIADRASFQAELDKLRAREKAHTREGEPAAVLSRGPPATGNPSR